jgi:hypothetical protein
MFGSGIAQASLGQLYIDYQSETPWIIGGLLFLYIIFIFAMRMRKGSAGAGASVQPIFNFDRMRRAGLLSEDEYKNIKRKAMTQTAEALAGAEPASRDVSGGHHRGRNGGWPDASGRWSLVVGRWSLVVGSEGSFVAAKRSAPPKPP